MGQVAVELVEEQHRPKIGWLCRNLREKDHHEVMAVQFTDDPDMLAEKIMVSKGFTWMFTLDRKPVAIVGAACMWPNVWQAFAFGTEDYPKVIVALTRHTRNFIVPALKGHGARMVHCWVQASYIEARNWIRMILPGVQEECVVKDFGKDGEAFVLMVWRPQEDG